MGKFVSPCRIQFEATSKVPGELASPRALIHSRQGGHFNKAARLQAKIQENANAGFGVAFAGWLIALMMWLWPAAKGSRAHAVIKPALGDSTSSPCNRNRGEWLKLAA